MVNRTMLAVLSYYLIDHRDEVLREWLEAVQRNPDILSSNHFSSEELFDHLPKLLENLAERLEHPQFHYDSSAVSHPGRSHGKFCWRQGYTLAEVIREAGSIRWILMRNWLDAFGQEVPWLDEETRRT